MILTHRPIKAWPDGWRERGYYGRLDAPFRSTYSQTLDLLDREIQALGGREVTMQVDVTERDIRLDGAIRADARPNHPGVILTIETRKHGTLVYATDRFRQWKENVRAIALGLEALRKIERYGIAERGQQYAGYREIGSGIALGPAEMTREQAARILVDLGTALGGKWEALLDDPQKVRWTYQNAVKAHHPDVGGDPAVFRTITTARDVLLGAAS